MGHVLIAELLCTDEGCAALVEVVVESLDELDRLVCEDCQCTLQTLSIAEAELLEVGRASELPHGLPRAA